MLKQLRLILTYLIPCHLLTTHTLPTPALLEPYPHLQTLFLPLAQCIKKGDLYAFDQALKEGEDEFVKRRIYLPLERAHDTCLRNLLRKVFLAGGFEAPNPQAPPTPPMRRTRVPVPEFTAAVRLSSKQDVDSDEVECQLANMIYKVSQLEWSQPRPAVLGVFHHRPYHSSHVLHGAHSSSGIPVILTGVHP